MNKTDLSKAVAGSPRRLLLRLAEEAERGSTPLREATQVKAHLATGAVISGRLLRAYREDQVDYVSLAVGDHWEDPGLACLRIDDVIALEVTPASTLVQLSAATARESSLGPAPTRLQLKRDLEALNQRLAEAKRPAVECDWSSVGESRQEMVNLKAVLQALPAALDRLFTAPSKISRMTVCGSPDEPLKATLQSDRVTLACGLGLPVFIGLDLQKEIDQKLKAVL